MKIRVEKDNLSEVLKIFRELPIVPGIFPTEHFQLSITYISSDSFLVFKLVSNVYAEFFIPFQVLEKDIKKDRFPVCVRRDLLDAFIRAAEDVHGSKDVDFIFNEKEVLVKNGRRSVRLAVSKEEANYGVEAKDLKKVALHKDAKDLILKSTSFASVRPSEPEKNCVYLSEKNIYACRQTVASRIKKVGIASQALIIPLGFAGIWKSINEQGVLRTSKAVINLKLKNGSISQPLYEPGWKKFPISKLDGLFTSNNSESSAYFGMDSLVRAADRFSLYISCAAEEERFAFIEFTPKKNEAILKAKIRSSEFVEILKVSGVQGNNDKPFIYELSSDLFLPMIQVLKDTGEKQVLIARQKNSPFYLISAGNVLFALATKG